MLVAMTEQAPVPGRIAVSRAEGGVGAFRAMAILVDGRKVASVLTGDRVVLDVSAASHQVSARMDWARSPDLTVQVSDDAVAEIAVSFPLMSGVLNLALRPRRAILITARP